MVPNSKRRLLGQLPIVLAADLVGVLVSRVARAIAARLEGGVNATGPRPSSPAANGIMLVRSPRMEPTVRLN
jgi:hypothetical protein